jgi:hypothetical protein
MTARKLIGAAIAAALSAAFPAPASASLLVPGAECPALPAERTFLPWLDPAAYTAFPDAGFESGGQGWTFSGATVVDGNEPWRVNGADDRRAARLPAGASVTSPPVCVAVEHPTIRFFARSVGLPTGLLTVSVIVPTGLGLTAELPVGVVADPTSQWSPTLPLPVVANLLTLVDRGTLVRVRIRSTGAWLVDDVMLDPYSKR